MLRCALRSARPCRTRRYCSGCAPSRAACVVRRYWAARRGRTRRPTCAVCVVLCQQARRPARSSSPSRRHGCTPRGTRAGRTTRRYRERGYRARRRLRGARRGGDVGSQAPEQPGVGTAGDRTTKESSARTSTLHAAADNELARAVFGRAHTVSFETTRLHRKSPALPPGPRRAAPRAAPCRRTLPAARV